MLHVQKYPPSAGELPSVQPSQVSAEPSLWLVAGKRRLPVGVGRSTGEELSSVGPPGGRGRQDPAPKRAGLSYEKSVCKPGLLVVQANVKGFEKPWRVLIDLGGLGSYARRFALEERMHYAEALKVQTRHHLSPSSDGDTGFCVEGLSWLERQEPRIDWRSETLGATYFTPSGAMVSHEPNSARKQKRFWRGHEAKSAMVQGIGMSELVSNDVFVGPEQSSPTWSRTLSGERFKFGQCPTAVP
ncbi:hypothetical protein PC114_g26045 [Phytophthora cactorum]|nr:hypothetical protein PC114_g26045 [Phytophthora cactorum]